MQLKNDNTVALERRMDLASLFCMIGRHGPAVVLALIGMVSVVMGFIIYRTVKGKWRKATAGSDSRSPGAERESASLDPEPSGPEGFLRSAMESTDVKVLSDAVLIQSDVRRRRSAAEKKPAPPPPHYYYYPPESDSVPDGRHHTSALQDSSKITQAYAEDLTNHSPRHDTPAEEDDEGHDHVSCVTPEQNYRDEEQVSEEKCENVSTEMDVSEEKEEEMFLDSKVCFEHKADDKLQDDEVTIDTNSNMEEPVIHNEDVSCVKFDHISSEVETKSVCEEAAEECVEHQTAQQVGTVDLSFEDGTMFSSQHKEQCDGLIDEQFNDSLTSDVSEGLQTEQEDGVVKEEILTPCKDVPEISTDYQQPQELAKAKEEELCDLSICPDLTSQNNDGLSSDVSVENVCEDHVSSLTECDSHSLQQDLQVEQKENVLKEEILSSCEVQEEKHEHTEAAVECVEHQLTGQHVESTDPSFEEGTILLTTQQEEQCDNVIEEQNNDGLSSDVSIENVCEDLVSSLTESEVHSLQQEAKAKQGENDLKVESLTSCEEEAKGECKKPAEQCVEHQPTGQQVETIDKIYEEGTILLATQQEEQCDGVTDEQYKDGLTSDVSVENLCEDHVSSLAESEAHSLQRVLQTEQEEGGVLEREVQTSCEEEETKDECKETVVECVDNQPTGQQMEIIDTSFYHGTVLSSLHKEQCDGVTDEQYNDGLTSDVSIENVCEDHVSSLEKSEVHSLQQEPQAEQQGNVLKEEILTSCENEAKSEYKEAAVECVEHQPPGQQVETSDESFDHGTVLSSPHIEECDGVIDEQCKDGLTSNVSIESVCEGHVSSLAELEVNSPQHDLQTEQKEDGVLNEKYLTSCEKVNSHFKEAAEECVEPQLTAQQVETVGLSFEDKEQCGGLIDEQFNDSLTSDVSEGLQTEQEGGVVKEEILTPCKEHERSSVVLTPLKAVEPEVVDSLCGTTTDEKALISDVDVPEISTDYQQPQELAKAKEEELCDLQSPKEEIQSENNETSTVLSSFYKDQSSEIMEHEQMSQNTDVTFVTDGAVCVEGEDKQCEQIQKGEDFQAVTLCDSLEIIKSPICPIQLSSFEQSELLSFGEESGISSMTISPDVQDDEFVTTPENVQSEEQTKLQVTIGLYADDMPLSVFKGQTDQAIDESFAANEDMFGHEVEDSYHRDMEQFMAQIVTNVTSITTETTKKTDIKEGDEKTEEEQECEKTEISIMEATMDNNEWITDGNYQVLPWMNLSIPCLVQNHTKTDPAEEHQHCPSPADVPRIDTDITLSVEPTPVDTFLLVEENTESNKKVVAVQPMPQNVNVTFRIHYLTHSPYQTVAITGNHEELGNWKGFIPLERAKDGHWATVVSLPAESHVEWKFVVLDKGEVCRWEECGNRLLDTGYGDDLLVHKWWGLL